MTAQERYWGFPITVDLHVEAQQTIALVRESEQGGSHLNERAAEVILQVTHSGLHSYYQKPVGMVPMAPTLRKAADTGIKVVMGAIGLVVRQFFKNRSHDELRLLVDHVEPMLWVHPERQEPHVVFVLQAGKYEQAMLLIERVRTDPQRDAYIDEVVDMLSDVLEQAIFHYYKVPTDKIDLKGFTRKATDMGMGQAEKGIRGLINRLVRDLPHHYLVELSAHVESLLHADDLQGVVVVAE